MPPPPAFAAAAALPVRAGAAGRRAHAPRTRHVFSPAKRRRAPRPAAPPAAAPRVVPMAIQDPLLPAVKEALELLAATTVGVPLAKWLKLSPILAFLVVGVVLGPHGARLIGDVEDISELAELGVLFLLFSMGLELNLERLRKLKKYVFGMGSLQVAVTTAVLGLGAYGMGATFPEAVVIGSGLSLSSSAFVLQLLAEKGERQSRAGAACYGVLLLQDLATIPALVLVPLLGSRMWLSPSDMEAMIVGGARNMAGNIGVLGAVILGGGFVLRRVFSIVADSKSNEAFTSTVLLTVLGTACLTAELGLPMTLGSFIAGVLLAESSFRSRIIVDMEPFRGLFLGLFFITTGMSMDLTLFVHAPAKMAFLVSSLILWKSVLATLSGLPVGLSLAESARVGLLVAQGGEFSFVLFNIGSKLGFLPADISAYLITTVVATMALTPALYEAGLFIAPVIDRMVKNAGGQPTPEAALQDVATSDEAFVVIFGYGPVGQVVGRMLSRKFIKWVAVDIDLDRVQKGVASNLPIIYGDSVHPTELLHANDLPAPSAFVISHSEAHVIDECLDAVRSAFPDRPVYVRAKDVTQQKNLLGRGAMAMFPETLETSLSLGAAVLDAFGTVPNDVSAIKKELRDDGDVESAFEEYEGYWKSSLRRPVDDIQSPYFVADDEVDGVRGGAPGTAATIHSILTGREREASPSPPAAASTRSVDIKTD